MIKLVIMSKKILFSFIVLLLLISGYFIFSEISVYNGLYLDDALKRSLKIFASLSALKVGLSIVEGSEIGVGFGLQVGDVVQSTYDFVHITWFVVLVGCVALIGTKYLLQLVGVLGCFGFILSVLLITIAVFIKKKYPERKFFHKISRDISLIVSILTISLYIILPLSVLTGSWLSGNITRPVLVKSETCLSNIQKDMFPDQPNDKKNISSLWSGAKDKINKIADYLKSKKDEFSLLGFQLISIYIFDCLLFPLLIFGFLLGIVKYGTRYMVMIEV